MSEKRFRTYLFCLLCMFCVVMSLVIPVLCTPTMPLNLPVLVVEDISQEQTVFPDFASEFYTMCEAFDQFGITVEHSMILADESSYVMSESSVQYDNNTHEGHQVVMKPNYFTEIWFNTDEPYYFVSIEDNPWSLVTDETCTADIKMFLDTNITYKSNLKTIDDMFNVLKDNDYIQQGNKVSCANVVGLSDMASLRDAVDKTSIVILMPNVEDANPVLKIIARINYIENDLDLYQEVYTYNLTLTNEYVCAVPEIVTTNLQDIDALQSNWEQIVR